MVKTLKKPTIILSLMIFFVLIIFFSGLSFIKTRRPPEIHDLTSIEFYNEDGDPFFELNNNNVQNYTQIENISPHVINAFISVEDQKFYKHHGIDYLRIVKSMIDNISQMRKGFGASTITQQYARNLYLTHEKSYERKLKEIYYAMLIESNYEKDDILEGYLNTIYFGHGIYGVTDAAYYYFNKDVKDLSIREASILAAIVKAPTYYSPISDYEQNTERSLLILKLMKDQKKITKSEYEESVSESISIIGKHPRSKDNIAPYYQDILTKELESLNIIQDDFYRGVKVYTTLNTRLNEIILKQMKTVYSPYSKIEGAVFAIDPRTGYVKAVVGGRDYETSQFNRATQSLRHPGSTIKPLLYYKALEYGFTPSTTFKSEPTTFYVNNGLTAYSPSNFRDQYPYQDISMAYAAATSDNIYAVKTHLYLGASALINTARRVGITSEMEPLPSLALGATGVKLSELTTAYAHFASLGQQVKPVYITKVTDMNDQVLYEYQPEPLQVLDRDVCFVLNYLLTGMFDPNLSARATGVSITDQLSHTYSGKSGSTDHDNLMIGYNPKLVLGVWTGYDEEINLTTSQEKTYSKRLWALVMNEYFQYEPNTFFEPTDHVVSALIDPVSGKLATNQTPYRKFMYYIDGTEPHDYYKSN